MSPHRLTNCGNKKAAWTGGLIVRVEWTFVRRFAESFNKADGMSLPTIAQ